jgi:L,D-peptidoglycan transpeptidase YkuD (ErfK/YbiS/YcfS/YnhG family)
MIKNDRNITHKRRSRNLYIRSLQPSSPYGRLHIGPTIIPCLLGKNGMTYQKREGDQKTPRGHFKIIKFLFRPKYRWFHKSPHKQSLLRPQHGWCDDPTHALYNRPCTTELNASHEKLWRRDQLYDLIGILDYNIKPRRRFYGSAIFLHLFDTQTQHTQGCIAISPDHMRKLLPRLSSEVIIHID